MLKITLICPKWTRGLSSMSFFNSMPPQSLLQLRSLTPLNWEVKIINENEENINFQEKTDLVGLTAMSALAPRAYEIAKQFHSQDTTVIMGGIHASNMPQETIQHVDSVVIGEADLIWPQILADFEKGELKKFYQAKHSTNLNFSRFRKINNKRTAYFSKYLPFFNLKMAYIQTQRGCPHNCNFCSVTKFNGRKIRKKDIDIVIQEIKEEKKFDYLIFVDDNIMADKAYAKELFQKLIPLKIKWISQSDIRIADPDIIDLAVNSGLSAVFLGLESIKSSDLRYVCKTKEYWRTKYEKSIKRLHQKKVLIMGSFIFGFDGGDKGTIQNTVQWAIKNKLDLAQFSILTPLPGTDLFQELSQQKRILNYDWEKYNTFELVFKTKGWHKNELQKKINWAYKKFYSIPSILKRINKLPALHLMAALATNFEFRFFH